MFSPVDCIHPLKRDFWIETLLFVFQGASQKLMGEVDLFLCLRQRERSAPQLGYTLVPSSKRCIKRHLSCFQLGFCLIYLSAHSLALVLLTWLKTSRQSQPWISFFQACLGGALRRADRHVSRSDR
jgi:hypothetical protein